MKDEIDFYLQHTGDVKISKMTRDDLKNLIATGEGTFLEFKHKVSSPEKIAREMCAFANSKGGKILIGVEDNGDMIGIESFLEEEFWLNKAAKEVCTPELIFTMELLHLGQKDIMIVDVPEAEQKPIFVKGKNKRTAFIRHNDESVTASEDKVEILKNGSSEEGITFEYGEREQLLFRFLKEYSEITVERFSILINVTTYRSSRILVNLASAGILNLFERDGVEYYTFTQKSV
tara:strand:+ start:467 stop:1165 length:699 start_codon:yes stop_codon:yes gene_type:complete